MAGRAPPVRMDHVLNFLLLVLQFFFPGVLCRDIPDLLRGFVWLAAYALCTRQQSPHFGFGGSGCAAPFRIFSSSFWVRGVLGAPVMSTILGSPPVALARSSSFSVRGVRHAMVMLTFLVSPPLFGYVTKREKERQCDQP